MNFIVGRLRKYLEEEDAFWVFVMIIESLLPFDYFALMIGVLIDQKTFMQMVQEKLLNVHDKFQELGFDPSILAFQWFVCLFSYNMPEETSLRILDLIMLRGHKAIFSIGLALVHLMKDQILICKDISDMFKVLESRNKIFALSPHILYIA
mmetsp:Transcript_23149/g.22627  ORF Transcript_23149/g.22627 Transcript_23149/m.22627 type:complete len:151 (-) Transcript_23149:1069-1521(-)|eukprot:CAMPEP_0170568304 /NCGR_PEP_ID=MMETSP0211-20121228/81089_1 /TAXON_ID=311385 /ORGANISM="Pseudokeronopsis sp., Strain OXSARD2" /LENGTH=150 /DNA_ID=CAMNT_0010890115 /DNA_START=766 /DNA_END=1218 /DNA_ORIENTATION=+